MLRFCFSQFKIIHQWLAIRRGPNRAFLRTSFNSPRKMVMVFFFLWSLIPQTLLGNESNVWSPDFTHVEGQLSFLLSLTAVHKDLVTKNAPYQRNPFELTAPVPEVLKLLQGGGHETSVVLGQDQVIYNSTFSGDGAILVYDERRIKTVKENLKSDIDKMFHLLRTDPFGEVHLSIPQTENSALTMKNDKTMAAQAMTIEFYLNGFKKEPQKEALAVTAIKIIPLLFNLNGQMKNEVKEFARLGGLRSPEFINKLKLQIENLTGNDLQNLYFDLLKIHLKDFITKDNYWENKFNSMQNNWMNKSLAQALQMRRPSDLSSNGNLREGPTKNKAAQKFYSLEKVAGPIALLRGFVGFDCSMYSVPFYPLLKEVQVFWIRKETNPEADVVGYALVVEAHVGSKKIPYILTINGSTLSADDIPNLSSMIGTIFEADEVAYPDFSINPHVVNNSSFKDAFEILGPAKSVQLEIPKGWEIIDRFSQKKSGFEDYYLGEKIKTAKIVMLPKRPLTLQQRLHRSAYPPVDILQVPVVERALLLANAREDIMDHQLPEFEEIRLKYGVTAEQMRLMDLIHKKNQSEDALSMQELEAIKNQFKISSSKILKLLKKDSTRVYTKASLFSESFFEEYVEVIPLLKGGDGVENDSETQMSNYVEALTRYVSVQWPEVIWRLVPELMAHKDSYLRMKIAFGLSSQAHWSEATWNLVPKLMSDPDPSVRLRMIYALKSQHHWPQEVWNGVLDLMKDRDLFIRARIVDSLGGQVQWPLAVWSLVPELMKDGNREAQKRLLHSLRSQPVWPHEVWKNVAPLMAHSDLNIREAMAEALRLKDQWPPEFWEKIPLLMKAPMGSVRSRIVVGLSTQPHWPASVWSQVPVLMQDSEIYIRRRIIEALRSQSLWPESVWRQWVALLKDADTDLRWRMVEALKLKPIWPESVWQEMPKLLSESRLEVRLSTAEGLVSHLYLLQENFAKAKSWQQRNFYGTYLEKIKPMLFEIVNSPRVRLKIQMMDHQENESLEERLQFLFKDIIDFHRRFTTRNGRGDFSKGAPNSCKSILHGDGKKDL